MKKQKTEQLNTDRQYGEKLEEAFLTHLGATCKQQQEAELEQYGYLKAPEELDAWVEEFCQKKKGYSAEESLRSLEYEELLAKAAGMEQKLQRQQHVVRHLRKIAIFAVMLFGLCAGATATAKAFGIDLWKVVTKDKGDNLIIAQQDRAVINAEYFLSTNWYGYYYPSYVPEGYDVVEDYVDKATAKLVLADGDRKLSYYCVYFINIQTIDTELSQYEVIQIGDQRAYYQNNLEMSSVNIFMEHYSISFFYEGLAEEEVDKIVKNIKYFEKK